MAGLPPPPVNDQMGSFTWLEWYRQLRNYVSTSGSVPWYIINFAGSNLTDIATRNHNQLQGLQGGGAGEMYHLTAAQYAALAAGNHNDLSGLQGGTVSERYHTTFDQNEAISHLTWNAEYGTIDMEMGHSDATNQLGLEIYRFCHNQTGSTIPNGTVVSFAGSHVGHVAIAPVAASTTLEPNQVVGITTSDILDNDHGYVTWYGLIHDLDTTGTSVGETWVAGDVLYLHPTIAGALTKVKPTAPYVALPMCGVVTVNATTGVIAVKPTPSPRLYYGVFSDTTTQTISVANTAQAITFNTTEINSEVTIGSPTSRIVCAKSGLYSISYSAQLSATNSSTKTVWMWLRKNGTNITNSTRKITVSSNNEILAPTGLFTVSLAINDYVELMWASDYTTVSLTPATATAFAPSASSIRLTVNQINQ